MSRPRITLLTQIFPPESNAGANRAGAAALALASVADLRVVTILPSYPSPEHHRLHNTIVGHDEKMPYTIERSGEFHPHRGSYLLRAAREITMAARVAWRAARTRPDVFVATSPSIFIGIAGAVVCRIRRRPLVVDLRDLTWEYLAGDSSDRSAVIRALALILAKTARLSLKQATLISVSNLGIRQAVEDLGIDSSRIIDIPNGVSSDLLARGAALPEPMADPSRFVVTYAGALGYYQGLSTLIEVAGEMPDVDFRVIGDGPERAGMVQAVRRRSLSNVELPGYLSRGEVFGHYGESNIMFAQLRDLPVLSRATFPSKPYELMTTGRPIVYAGTGITADFLRSTGSALIAEPENAESIAAAIRKLIDDKAMRDALGNAGRRAAPRYLRETIMSNFATAVLDITSDRPPA